MYKIEIWRYHSITETFENKNAKKVLKWYKDNWQTCFDYGGCTFYLYKDDKKLSFEEAYELGFYDYED